MQNPHRARRIALAFLASGGIAVTGAFLLPGDSWVRTCLFIYGASAILFGGGTALFRHFDVRAKETLARGDNLIARWRVESAAWREFVSLDQGWSRQDQILPNELSWPDAVAEEGLEVRVGRDAIQIGESIHRLTSGMPEVTAAHLVESQPAVIELQLYYPGGGYGASGVPQSARRAALRFPVGRGCGKEAGAVVSYYRGDAPRKEDFFHGKGDGTDSEDLTRCYHCGYETYKLMSHCPQCGRSMQSKRWSRRYGWVLLLLGLVISGVIGLVLLAIGPGLLGWHRTATNFTGSVAQGRMAFALLSLVELFGLVAIFYGIWQIVTGRRSKWVIYFTIGFAVVVVLFALFL
jgi:hypothetical protein